MKLTKHNNSKICLSTLLLLVSNSVVFGQEQMICVGETKIYKVDTDENNGYGTTNSTYVWQVNDTSFLGSIQPLTPTNNQVKINWANTPKGRYILEVTENNICGSMSKQLAVLINEEIAVSIAPIFHLCPENSATVILYINAKYDEYFWYDENDNLVGTSPTYEATKPGKYSVIVSNGSCKSRAETIVETVIFPSIIIKTDATQVIHLVATDGNTDVEYQLEKPDGTIIFPWQKSTTFPVVEKGEYVIRVRSINGNCFTQISTQVYQIPNAFTPNSDGINDTWDLSLVLKDNPNAVVKIFNRYGHLLRVLTIKDQFRWDGKTNNAKLETGSYWYLIELENGQHLQGSVLLKSK